MATLLVAILLRLMAILLRSGRRFLSQLIGGRCFRVQGIHTLQRTKSSEWMRTLELLSKRSDKS